MKNALPQFDFWEIFHDAPVGGLVLDHNQRIIVANRTLHRLLGYFPGSLDNSPYKQLVYLEDALPTQQFFDALSEDRWIHYEIEQRYVGNEGELLWVRLSGCRFKTLTNDTFFVGFVVPVVHTITDAAQMRDALQAVGHRTRVIAHGMNNLLTIVSSYCQVALNEQHNEEELSFGLTKIQRAAEDLHDVSEQLSRLGQFLTVEESPPIEPSALHCYLQDRQDVLQALLGDGIDFELTTHYDVGPLDVSPYALDEILVALIGHARTRVENKSKLKIEVLNITAQSKEECSRWNVSKGNYVVFSVHNLASNSPSVYSNVVITTCTQGDRWSLKPEPHFSALLRGTERINGHVCCHQSDTFAILFPRLD